VPLHTTGSLLAGRYRVLRPLGSGGMATVMLCTDERLGREVAVKRLHAHSPEDAARRFAREAKVGASLNHPNLVTVFDTVTDEEAVLIVMEFVPGLTLRVVLRDGALSPRAAIRLVRDLAAGLDHAHAHGVVHRDVKPGNVLLRDEDGVAKLADLGIAVAADQTRITQSGTVLGTAAYMAPEQLEGSASGPATDIYALAAVAFEALSGKRARRGRTAVEIAHQVVNEGPPEIADLRPELPPEVGEALKHGMARAPGDRPSSAGALADALELALEEEPTVRTRRLRPGGAGAPRSTRAATPPQRAAPNRSGSGMRPSRRGASPPSGRTRRRRGWIAAAGLLGVAAVAIAVLLLGTVGGDDGSGGERAQQGGSEGRAQARGGQGGQEARQPAVPAEDAPAEEQPAPQESDESSGGSSDYAAPEPSGSDPRGAARLNDQGFARMGEGRFEEAVPLLEQAVAASKADDDTYAYALYNLGSSLRQAGRPEDAIPVLERRLQIPNQAETVQAELDRAKQDASG
jgi:eukaryotic-like serine/threonine-protein kinase